MSEKQCKNVVYSTLRGLLLLHDYVQKISNFVFASLETCNKIDMDYKIFQS